MTIYDEARKRHSGDPVMLANIDRDERLEFRLITEGPDVVGACPPWCGLPAGHPFDDVLAATEDDEVMTFVRTHQLSDDEDEGIVYMNENYRGGVVTCEPPHILVGDDCRPTTDTAAVRREAAYMLAAADALDAITGATS